MLYDSRHSMYDFKGAEAVIGRMSAIPGQKSASIMLDQWNFGTMPLSLPVKARVVGG